MRKGHSVIEVHRFAFRLGAVGVNQHDFGCQAAEKERISKGRTDIAYTDDSDTYRPSMIFHISFHGWFGSSGDESTIDFPITFALVADLQQTVLGVVALFAIGALQ